MALLNFKTAGLVGVGVIAFAAWWHYTSVIEDLERSEAKVESLVKANKTTRSTVDKLIEQRKRAERAAREAARGRAEARESADKLRKRLEEIQSKEAEQWRKTPIPRELREALRSPQ